MAASSPRLPQPIVSDLLFLHTLRGKGLLGIFTLVSLTSTDQAYTAALNLTQTPIGTTLGGLLGQPLQPCAHMSPGNKPTHWPPLSLLSVSPQSIASFPKLKPLRFCSCYNKAPALPGGMEGPS